MKVSEAKQLRETTKSYRIILSNIYLYLKE